MEVNEKIELNKALSWRVPALVAQAPTTTTADLIVGIRYAGDEGSSPGNATVPDTTYKTLRPEAWLPQISFKIIA